MWGSGGTIYERLLFLISETEPHPLLVDDDEASAAAPFAHTPPVRKTTPTR